MYMKQSNAGLTNLEMRGTINFGVVIITQAAKLLLCTLLKKRKNTCAKFLGKYKQVKFRT